MRNQVAFPKAETGNASGQHCEGTIVPTIPLGISEIPSSAQNTDVYWRARKQTSCVATKVHNLQMANKVRVDFGF